MGIFKSLFGSTSSDSAEKTSFANWIPLESMEQLDEITSLSEQETVAIFKHSTRCGISRMVIERFEESVEESLRNFKLYYLDLLNHRDISNEISTRFQVLHQSPQLLVIKSGTVIKHASHSDINTVDLKIF